MKRRTEHFTYELLRARRRSMSLKVELDGTITVRAPFRTPPETADWFVESHRDWIEVRLRRRTDPCSASVLHRNGTS